MEKLRDFGTDMIKMSMMLQIIALKITEFHFIADLASLILKLCYAFIAFIETLH